MASGCLRGLCTSALGSEPREAEAFVHAAAAGAGGEGGVGFVLELEAAAGAAEDVVEGSAFAAGAGPAVVDPGAEDGGEEERDVEEDEDGEGDADHSDGGLFSP